MWRKAIEEQNNQYAAGKVGTSPTTDDQQLVYTIRTKGQLLTPEEFGNITVRSRGADGIVRIHDIARVEVGNRSYEAYNQLNDVPSVTFAVYLQTGANAMQTAVDVKKRLQELSKNFPDDIAYVITDDNSRFVEAALNEVVQTLLEAGLLVLLVVYLFLQNWRSDPYPDACGAGFFDRYISRSLGSEFLSEYLDAFCDDARHRYCGGRCDRGAGKRRTYYGDGKAQRFPSFSEGYEGSGGRSGCHCAGAEYGIYTGGVLGRYCR